MAYVNSPPPKSDPAKSNPATTDGLVVLRQIARRLAYPQVRASFAISLVALLVLLVTLLALAPPYAGLAGFELDPARLAAPIFTYLFRNAVINTGWLVGGVYLLALPLGWTWAVTGIQPLARPFLLLPIFIPGALLGLLWRPLFAPWLNLAQAEIALLVTGLALLWRAVPLAAWLFSQDRDAWPKFIPLCALLVLLNGDLVLTLTRGEPFNAAHTWPSWLITQLWVSRAWGYAASMAGALAFLLTGLVWWAMRRTPTPIVIPHGSPLGLGTLLVWMLAPFTMPLLAFAQSPRQAISILVGLGALFWLLNGALVWSGATLLAMRFAWKLPNERLRHLARSLTVAMLPITTVTLAYLVHQLPMLGNRWLLLGITALFTAGLLLGDDTQPTLRRDQWLRAAGYAALVLAHTFPLQLVLQLPASAWTPTLGVVWMLADAPHATSALGGVLLLYGAWAGVGAWLVAHR